MDPNTLPKPQFELSKPPTRSGEAIAPNEGDPENQKATENRNMEQAAVQAPTQPINASQAAQSVHDAQAAGAVSPVPLMPGQTPISVPVTSLPAEDGDLIEKAWVQKAKEIVDHTRDDPYTQNREINKVKKEYIQKRYQKDVKLTDE